MRVNNTNITMHKLISDDIREKIRSGFFRGGDKLPSEQGLAEKFRVSRITSKKALDDLENEGLIYRVKGSGSYVSKRHEPARKIGRWNAISLLLPFNYSRGGGLDTIHGIESVLKNHGYYLIIHNSYGMIEKERELMLKLVADGMEGIIYYPSGTAENFDILHILSTEGYPLVMIDKSIHDIRVDSVASENFEGSYRMTEYLIRRGHRNIAYVSGSLMHLRSSLRERFLGYSKALSDYNIPIKIENIMPEHGSLQKDWDLDETDERFFRQMVDTLYSDGKGVTAIEASIDLDAIELIKAAVSLGIKVPEELSVVGYDDLDVARMISPTLTTVRQDFYQMGVKAAELIMSKIKNPQRKVENIRVPTQLIERKSVASRSEMASIPVQNTGS